MLLALSHPLLWHKETAIYPPVCFILDLVLPCMNSYEAPCILLQALPPTTMALSIYCTSITVFFVIIKLANYRLHLMFDEGEAIVRSSLSDLSKAQEKKSNASDSCQPASIRYKQKNPS